MYLTNHRRDPGRLYSESYFSVSVMFASIATFELGAQDRDLRRIQARGVSEGAAQMALQSLRGVSTIPAGTTSGKLGDHDYTYGFTSRGGSTYDLEATGTAQGITSTLTVRMSVDITPRGMRSRGDSTPNRGRPARARCEVRT